MAKYRKHSNPAGYGRRNPSAVYGAFRMNPKKSSKAEATTLVSRAEYYAANGDIQKAKSVLEEAYPLIDPAYPAKWAQELLSRSAYLRAVLKRFGVEVRRATPEEGWKDAGQGREW